jgi:hypothetical protein
MIKSALLWALATLLVCTLGGCGRSETYRYKLTLSVDTPDGVKTAFNVVEVRHAAVTLPARGVNTRVKGEALYLDLGPGRRPLVALLTKRLPDNIGPREAMRWRHWIGDAPTTLLALLNGQKFPMDGLLDVVARFHNWRGPNTLPIADLPELVTFADIRDPTSVMAVDPDNLSATLGDGVKWKSATLEVTDDAKTTGITQRLQPWLTRTSSYLSGKTISTSNDLPSRLHNGDFILGK